jgi:hypothetical protein
MHEAIAKFKGGVREVRDEDSMNRRRIQAQQQLEQEEKLLEVRGKQWAAAEARKQREEESKFLAMTGGRHELIQEQGQVLFEQKNCEICNSPCMYVLSGWNMNRDMKGYSDITIPYNPGIQDKSLNFTKRHVCSSSNPIELCGFLAKRIEKLESDFKKYQQFVATNFKRGPFL